MWWIWFINGLDQCQLSGHCQVDPQLSSLQANSQFHSPVLYIQIPATPCLFAFITGLNGVNTMNMIQDTVCNLRPIYLTYLSGTSEREKEKVILFNALSVCFQAPTQTRGLPTQHTNIQITHNHAQRAQRTVKLYNHYQYGHWSGHYLTTTVVSWDRDHPYNITLYNVDRIWFL